MLQNAQFCQQESIMLANIRLANGKAKTKSENKVAMDAVSNAQLSLILCNESMDV